MLDISGTGAYCWIARFCCGPSQRCSRGKVSSEECPRYDLLSRFAFPTRIMPSRGIHRTCPDTNAGGGTVRAFETGPSRFSSQPSLSGIVIHRRTPGRSIRSFLHSAPTFTAEALFLLILSGPPKFRIRDPEASLRGEIDWVVKLHLVVWGLAGLWVLLQMTRRPQGGLLPLRLHIPQVLGLGVVFGLTVSISASAAPALTAFKIYQILVSMLFTQIF